MASDGYTPTPWQVQLLGEVADITLGGTPSTEVTGFWGGDIPWMASGEVNKRHIFEVDGRITEAGLAASNATLVDPPAVAVGLAGQGKTRGTAAMVHVRVCTNQSIALIKGKSGRLDTRFLFHNLDSRYEELRSRSAGGGRAGLSREILQKVPVLLPDPWEQSRISAVLDTVDEAIAKTEAVIAKLKQMRAGLLHDLLTRGLDEHGHLRDPIIHPEQFQDSPLGRIPNEWEVKELGDYVMVVRGFAFRSQDYTKTGILNFKVTNVGLPPAELEDAGHLPNNFWPQFPNQQLHGGEVVIVMVGATTGKIGRVPQEICPALMNQNLWNLVPKPGVDREFLWYSSPAVVERHIKMQQGSARDFLTQKDFVRTLVAMPKSDEQNRISAIALKHETRVQAEEAYAVKLNHLKLGLMADLLTGRVRVPETFTEGNP